MKFSVAALVPKDVKKNLPKVMKSRTVATVVALGVYALTLRLSKYLPSEIAQTLAQSLVSDGVTTIVWLSGLARIAWLKFDDHSKVDKLLKEKTHD